MYQCVDSRHKIEHLYENNIWSGNAPRYLERIECTLKEGSANCSYLEEPIILEIFGHKVVI